MKICFIGNGNSLHLNRWMEYFINQNHKIYLISKNNSFLENITFYDLNVANIYNLRQIFRILKVKKFINEIKPDILHIHSAEYGILALFTIFHPIVITLWGDDINYIPYQSKIAYWSIKQSLKNADLITGDSISVLLKAKKMFSLNNPLSVIQFGVDIDNFKAGINCTYLKEKLKIPLKDKIIISLRMFTMPYYNIDIIIEAIPYILKEFKDVSFILLGTGYFQNKLKQKVKNLNISEKVYFTGKISHQEMPIYLNLADIVISIPSVDATSVSVLESMSCELPVIVSDLPANREWIIDNWNGYIIPPRDKNLLIKRILMLLTDDKKRKLFGKRNVEIIKKKAQYRANMEKMDNLYKKLKKGENLWKNQLDLELLEQVDG